jgi:outer membrane protein, multidrug efflux system
MTERSTLAGALSAALLWLGGCANPIPAYERPAPPVAAAFTDEAPAGPVGTIADEIDWQRYFADERLKRLIGIALEDNRDLRVAVLSIEQARALYQIRRADELPTVSLAASGLRQPGAGGGMTSLYSVGAAVTAYELDFFGRVKSLSESALAQFFATEEARKTVQISLVASVANAYLGLLADDELLRVTKQTLATRQQSLDLTQLKFDNGVVSEVDVRQAESLLEAARVTLAQLTRQRALDQNALVLLLGRPLPSDLPPGLELTDRQVTAELLAGVPAEVLTRRPDVRQAEQQLIAANANIGAARAAFFPRITLTGSAGIASSDLTELFKGGSFAWTLAPQLVLPIFDRGRNRSNLDVATVSRDIAVAQYEKTVQTAFREVADSLAGRASLGDQLRAQTAQAAAEQARVRLADLRYRNGAASYLELLDAQRSLFAAQQAVIQLQAQQTQNLVTLYKVLGGGWSEAARSTARAERQGAGAH